MIIVFQVFSVFAKELCGGAPRNEYITEYDHFDSTVSSIRVLFQISTGQMFSGFITECQDYSDQSDGLITAFFFTFFVVGNFIFISLFVALLLDNLDLIASDDFAVSDLDIELWRASWLNTGLRLDEPMNVKDIRNFVFNAKGTFAFIHKADPYWYNRLLFELHLEPQDEIIAEAEIEFFKLLRAVCHIRFSSKCLSLDDEVQKSAWMRDHTSKHASAVIVVAVRAWLAIRNPPESVTNGLTSRKSYIAAVHCARLMQLHATIRTQRVTPEHVVSENLGRCVLLGAINFT
jgi:hypothetical protein